jgi:hypothetical protein
VFFRQVWRMARGNAEFGVVFQEQDTL